MAGLTDDPPPLSASTRALHARAVAQSNAANLAARHCMIHVGNPTVYARYAMELLIGNVITLCVPCLAWWRKDQAETGDALSDPVRIWELEAR